MSINDWLSLLMFASFIGLILTGFPVAWVLGGLSILFTCIAVVLDIDLGFAIGVDWAFTSLSVNRVWDVMKNWVLVALPMFIFMGMMLERSGIANDLMTTEEQHLRLAHNPRLVSEGACPNLADALAPKSPTAPQAHSASADILLFEPRKARKPRALPQPDAVLSAS